MIAEGSAGVGKAKGEEKLIFEGEAHSLGDALDLSSHPSLLRESISKSTREKEDCAGGNVLHAIVFRERRLCCVDFVQKASKRGFYVKFHSASSSRKMRRKDVELSYVVKNIAAASARRQGECRL